MTNVVEFVPRAREKEPPTPFYCSLNRSLLCVQYLVLVLDNKDRARALLDAITQGRELGVRVILPGEFREEVESTDTAATYRAVLGVDE